MLQMKHLSIMYALLFGRIYNVVDAEVELVASIIGLTYEESFTRMDYGMERIYTILLSRYS